MGTCPNCGEQMTEHWDTGGLLIGYECENCGECVYVEEDQTPWPSR